MNKLLFRSQNIFQYNKSIKFNYNNFHSSISCANISKRLLSTDVRRRSIHSLGGGINTFNFSKPIDYRKQSNALQLYLKNNSNKTGTIRHFSLSRSVWEHASSKVEESVKNIQEKEKEKDIPKVVDTTKVIEKKTLKQKIWAECLHYYHGFRLLFIDINVARKLLWKVLNGNTLTRREYRLLIRTTGDVFRLVPFSVFIIVPFLEFLLPVFIKFFPGMLPSQFETAKDKENKAIKSLKVKIEMAKFLQKTLDEMAVQHSDHKSEEAKEFVEFFNRLRTSGERATPEEIMKFSKLFEDEITLDTLSRQQLTAICKVLEVSTLGTSNFLRFQLRMKLRSLTADDRMIQKEGIETLNLSELQSACRARGMRSYGLSEQQLVEQLQEWVNLSLNEKVPPSLLLLSRAMMLPEDVPTSEKLKATISILSDAAVIQTKAAIGEREGKIDNKTKIEIIREEQRKIKEELDELKEQQHVIEKTEIILDQAPIIKDDKPDISTSDIDIVCDALDAVSKEKHNLMLEKEELKDLKEEIADYKEDVQELQQVKSEIKVEVQESAAAKILLKKVDGMINKLDKVLQDLDKKESKIQANLKENTSSDSTANTGGESSQSEQSTKSEHSEIVHIDEIMNAIKKMQKVTNEAKVEQIQKMLGKIDDDKDGQIKVDDVLKVIETIGKENVNLNEKQIDELIDLISKEETLEIEDKIEKAMAKSIGEKSKVANDKTVNNNNSIVDDSLKDPAKIITDADDDKKEILTDAQKISTPKVVERINQAVIENAESAVERQKDKIAPLSSGKIPTEIPRITKNASGNSKTGNDKML